MQPHSNRHWNRVNNAQQNDVLRTLFRPPETSVLHINLNMPYYRLQQVAQNFTELVAYVLQQNLDYCHSDVPSSTDSDESDEQRRDDALTGLSAMFELPSTTNTEQEPSAPTNHVQYYYGEGTGIRHPDCRGPRQRKCPHTYFQKNPKGCDDTESSEEDEIH